MHTHIDQSRLNESRDTRATEEMHAEDLRPRPYIPGDRVRALYAPEQAYYPGSILRAEPAEAGTPTSSYAVAFDGFEEDGA